MKEMFSVTILKHLSDGKAVEEDGLIFYLISEHKDKTKQQIKDTLRRLLSSDMLITNTYRSYRYYKISDKGRQSLSFRENSKYEPVRDLRRAKDNLYLDFQQKFNEIFTPRVSL